MDDCSVYVVSHGFSFEKTEWGPSCIVVLLHMYIWSLMRKKLYVPTYILTQQHTIFVFRFFINPTKTVG